MTRIEQLFIDQAQVRAAYRRGDIDGAIVLYDRTIHPAIGAVDHRLRFLARRIAHSLIAMVDNDLAA